MSCRPWPTYTRLTLCLCSCSGSDAMVFVGWGERALLLVIRYGWRRIDLGSRGGNDGICSCVAAVKRANGEGWTRRVGAG